MDASPKKKNETPRNHLEYGQESWSSDDDPNQTFYPNGRNRQSKGYFMKADIVPGQSEPFTLPPGSDHCPIPNCPAWKNGRIFRPPWRLNEHMKTRHGWPRRDALPSGFSGANEKQPRFVVTSTYQTRSGRLSGRRRDSSGLTASTTPRTQAGETSTAAVNNTSPSVTSQKSSQEPNSSTRPKRDRRQTEKGKEMASSMAQLAAATAPPQGSPPPAKKPRVSQSKPEFLHDGLSDLDDAIIEGSDSSMEIPDNVEDIFMDDYPSGPSSSFNKPAGVEVTRDHAYIEMIRSLIAELRVAANQNPELAKTADEYEEVLKKDIVRVNCSINVHDARILASCYGRLADRHNARAKIYSMHSMQVPYEPPRHAHGLPPSPYDTTSHEPATPNLRPQTSSQTAGNDHSSQKAFTFVNDAPSAASRRAALNAVSGLHVNPSRGSSSNGAVPPSSSVPKPIMLKLSLTPKQQQAADTPPPHS